MGMQLRATTLVALSLVAGFLHADTFLDAIPADRDRVWVGPEMWANRLQDWRVANGRLECVEGRPAKPMRTVHLLTHRLGKQEGTLTMSVITGLVDPKAGASNQSAAGFLLGAGGPDADYRAAAIVHHSNGPGGGIFAGVDGDGNAFIHDNKRQTRKLGHRRPVPPTELRLELSVTSEDGEAYFVRLVVIDAKTDKRVSVTKDLIIADQLIGNIALVSHPGRVHNRRPDGDKRQPGRYWFRDWKIEGTKLDIDTSRTAGPILSAQHTLSRGVMKMTAQLMPVGETDPGHVELEVKSGDSWKPVGREAIITPGWTATFRVADWDATKSWPYRLKYGDTVYGGTVRRDPVDKKTIVVAGFTGNHNCQRGVERPGFNWKRGMWFPHHDLTAHVVKHEPDILFFSGDQVYEGASPTGVDRPKLKLDYLYKWYLWCWAYRDLTRDLPTITIPDDHDIYQGNIWGESGRRTNKDDKGGYVHPADFVKMVERTQVSNLPDPYDPKPVDQGIGVYFTGMTYGRISFAILEDRKFKSGCNGRVPPSGSPRADHIVSETFDVKLADVPGVKLLGDRQLEFLGDWATDWRGADMKMALSQTVFAGMATHHGGNLQYLRADLDSNGWPQTGRNKALHELRRGFAFHLAGDQHLATITHHGIDTWDDACWTFTVPSIANFYPRKWHPKTPGKNREPGAPEYLGQHLDGLGNHVTVYGATNPGEDTGHEPRALHNRMPGYGIVRMDKSTRQITMECWPRFADPSDPKHGQYEGWPKTIDQTDNYGRKAVAWLPTLKITGAASPVVQIVEEKTGEVVYTLRIRGSEFRPKVFAAGTYTVKAGKDTADTVVAKNVNSLAATVKAELQIDLSR